MPNWCYNWLRIQGPAEEIMGLPFSRLAKVQLGDLVRINIEKEEGDD